MPWGRDLMIDMAEALATRGFAVWNIEYRRLGTPPDGWPITLDDVAAAVEHLGHVAAAGAALDLDRIVLVGHSAGGHLALWAAANANGSDRGRVRVAAVAGLAPVSDLARAHELNLGRGAVAELIGGSPSEYPDRYRAASPRERLPLAVRQMILHGTEDEDVPIELSRSYVQAALAAGDSVDFIELPGTGHMEYLDPSSPAFTTLAGWLERVTRAAQ
jgi:acetyl esterase/lipase